VFLVAIGLGGRHVWILTPSLFGVDATTMMAIPTIQVRLTGFVPQTPTLTGALNLTALNLANALGAEGGAVTIGADRGPLSTVWAGLVPMVADLVAGRSSIVIAVDRITEDNASNFSAGLIWATPSVPGSMGP
jgi:MFS transporter, DHA1 family, inner membrane transport protein